MVSVGTSCTPRRRLRLYLQGESIEGEVVYCMPPHRALLLFSRLRAGIPLVCVVKTPNIYGIPRAGRCLQRKVLPWCTDIMGLRQLDRGEPENTVRSDMFLVQTRYKEDEKLLMTCENSPHAAAKKSTAPPSPRLFFFLALLVMF